MKSIAIVLILLFSISGFAATDRRCVNDCREKGYKRDLCNEQCSYGNDGNSFGGGLDSSIISDQDNFEVEQTDPKCLNECTGEGYQYGFCKKRCSY